MTIDITPSLTDPAGYRFWIEERVRFADLDALGHVNNNAIGVYFESARVALLESCGGFRPDSPWTAVLARSVIEYKAELLYPATAQIGIRVLRLGNTSMVLGSGIFHGDTCIATQEGVCVIVDQTTHRPTPLSPALRDGLAPYGG
ncbi:MAG TPA: thioesterase family protein [Azospirillum sp.]|nr:thioesterase family protein [Azospirillum sp.]